MNQTKVLQTKIGPVQVIATDAHHLAVSWGGNYSGQPPISVRGVLTQGHAHFYIWLTDGEFHIGREGDNDYKRRESLYISRSNLSEFGKGISEPVRRTIAAALEAGLQGFSKNTDFLTTAETESLRTDIERAQAEVDATWKKHRVALDVLLQLKSQLKTHLGAHPKHPRAVIAQLQEEGE